MEIVYSTKLLLKHSSNRITDEEGRKDDEKRIKKRGWLTG